MTQFHSPKKQLKSSVGFSLHSTANKTNEIQYIFEVSEYILKLSKSVIFGAKKIYPKFCFHTLFEIFAGK